MNDKLASLKKAWADIAELKADNDRLRGLLRDAMDGLEGREAWKEVYEAIHVCLYGTAAQPTPLQVTCARCGIAGTSETFYVEEGDEWECPTCWERCEAKERATDNQNAP